MFREIVKMFLFNCIHLYILRWYFPSCVRHLLVDGPNTPTLGSFPLPPGNSVAPSNASFACDRARSAALRASLLDLALAPLVSQNAACWACCPYRWQPYTANKWRRLSFLRQRSHGYESSWFTTRANCPTAVSFLSELHIGDVPMPNHKKHLLAPTTNGSGFEFRMRTCNFTLYCYCSFHIHGFIKILFSVFPHFRRELFCQ